MPSKRGDRKEQPPELSEEDHQIFDKINDDMRKEEEERLARYAPIMRTLLRHLRAMDDEAKPLDSGASVGLWWYARHRRREEINPKNCRNEEDWSRRLKQLLDDEEIRGETEVRYPLPPRRRCDLVIQWPDIGRLWLEVKGAWKHNDRKGKVGNSSYKKHLYAAGDDLDKVCTLNESIADHYGLLLVGFDTAEDPILEEHVDWVRARPRRAGWIEQYEQWPDVYRAGGRVRVWLWLTQAKYLPDIFDAQTRVNSLKKETKGR